MLKLKELRLKKGLSQQALADKFNLSQQSIYKYEHGLAEPDIETLKGFARFFDVSIDYLVGFSDDVISKDCPEVTPINEAETSLIYEIRKLPADVRTSLILLINQLLK